MRGSPPSIRIGQRLGAVVILRRGRAEALHALALIARSRDAMAEGLVRLAAGDRALGRWSSLLVERLRAGMPLDAALLAARVVDRREAAALAATRDPEELAQALTRIADEHFDATPGYALVRWYPLWIVCALVLPPLAFACLLGSGGSFATLYREMGITLPDVSMWFVGTPIVGLCVFAAEAIAGMALLVWTIAHLRPLRHVLHLWCPEVHRSAAAIRLMRRARHDDGGIVTLGKVRWLWWRSGLGITRPGRPRWDLDWRTWMMLTRFRIGPAQRRMLHEMPDLHQRVAALGWASAPWGSARWNRDEDAVRDRYRDAFDATKALLVAQLVIIGFGSSAFMAIALILPLLGWIGMFG